MADHIRKQIRNAVIAKLKSANIVGDRVFGNRARKIFRNECPCILIYTDKEPAEVANEAPREFKRDLQLAVEIIVAGSASDDHDVDDQIDDLAVKVEEAMTDDETFGDLCADTVLGDTEMDIIEDGEKPIAAAKIVFSMPYFQYLPQKDFDDIDDLTSANVKIAGPGERPANPNQDANVLSTDQVDLDE